MAFRIGQLARKLAFGAINAWGFGSGGLDGMDAANAFGGSSDVGTRGGGGGYSSKGKDTGKDVGKNSSAQSADKNSGVDGSEGRREADRHGKDTSKRGPAERSGLAKSINVGAPLAMGPPGIAIGLLANAVDRAISGQDKNNYGMADVMDGVVSDVKGAVTGMVGGRFGGSLGGSLAGVPGAIVGNIAGSQLAKSTFDNDPGSPSGNTETAGFEGYAGNDGRNTDSNGLLESSPSVASSAPQGVATGWDSNFGTYGSHNSGFKSYGADTALNAFA